MAGSNKNRQRYHEDTWTIPDSQRSRSGTPQKSIYADRGAAVGYILQVILAFLAGYALIIVVNLIRITVAMDTASAASSEAMGADFIGIIISMVGIAALKELLRFKSAAFYQASFAGVMFSMLSSHNLVHMAPDLHRNIFPPEWVDMTLEQTRFRTLRWGDAEFELGQPSQTASREPLPQIIEPKYIELDE